MSRRRDTSDADEPDNELLATAVRMLGLGTLNTGTTFPSVSAAQYFCLSKKASAPSSAVTASDIDTLKRTLSPASQPSESPEEGGRVLQTKKLNFVSRSFLSRTLSRNLSGIDSQRLMSALNACENKSQTTALFTALATYAQGEQILPSSLFDDPQAPSLLWGSSLSSSQTILDFGKACGVDVLNNGSVRARSVLLARAIEEGNSPLTRKLLEQFEHAKPDNRLDHRLLASSVSSLPNPLLSALTRGDSFIVSRLISMQSARLFSHKDDDSARSCVHFFATQKCRSDDHAMQEMLRNDFPEFSEHRSASPSTSETHFRRPPSSGEWAR